jgi:hypothetical protein
MKLNSENRAGNKVDHRKCYAEMRVLTPVKQEAGINLQRGEDNPRDGVGIGQTYFLTSRKLLNNKTEFSEGLP